MDEFHLGFSQVMKSCWAINPKSRPKFKELICSLEEIGEDDYHVVDEDEDLEVDELSGSEESEEEIEESHYVNDHEDEIVESDYVN